MENRGFTVYRNKGTEYCAATFFDTYEQYQCLIYLFRYGAKEENRVLTTRISNAKGEYLDIWITDWNLAWKELFSRRFYEQLKEEGFRWIVPTNGVPIMRTLQHSGMSLTIKRHDIIFAGKPIAKQIKNVKEVCQIGVDNLGLDIAYLGTGKIQERTYNQYVIYDWVVELDPELHWDSLEEQFYSIDCGNMSSLNSFVLYERRDSKIYPILWVDTKYEVK